MMSNARNILEERLAKGEITEEEFESLSAKLSKENPVNISFKKEDQVQTKNNSFMEKHTINDSLPDDIRKEYIKELKEAKDGWMYYAASPVILFYIMFLSLIPVPTGWWILLWIFIGLVIIGSIVTALEFVTKTEKKLSSHSDELLSSLYSKHHLKKEANKKREQLLFIFFAGVLLVLFVTNPDKNIFQQKIDDSSNIFSSAHYNNRYLFSVYHSRNSLTNKEILYLGLLNQVFPIEDNH